MSPSLGFGRSAIAATDFGSVFAATCCPPSAGRPHILRQTGGEVKFGASAYKFITHLARGCVRARPRTRETNNSIACVRGVSEEAAAEASEIAEEPTRRGDWI